MQGTFSLSSAVTRKKKQSKEKLMPLSDDESVKISQGKMVGIYL
jgi:hypothetical protein